MFRLKPLLRRKPGNFRSTNFRPNKKLDEWPSLIGDTWLRETAVPLPKVQITAEDIKFCYNAWCLMRCGLYFGTPHPSVMSTLSKTRPCMHIATGGNRAFYMYADVGKSELLPSSTHVRIALSAHPQRAVSLHRFDWKSLVGNKSVQIVVGQENGMTPETEAACDHCVFIPQYGSCGSLSMINALSIAVHHAHSYYHNKPLGLNPPSEDVAKGLTGSIAGASCETLPLDYDPFIGSRPHSESLIGASDASVKEFLEAQRAAAPLQLGLVMYNELADRNIGAAIRNCNVYNCAKMVVLNRRKYSKRGSVGTHHYTPLLHRDTIDDAFEAGDFEGYELWALHNDHAWVNDQRKAECRFDSVTKDMSKNDKSNYFDQGGEPPYVDSLPFADDVLLDNEQSVVDAVRDVKAQGKKGILVVVPEESSYHRASIYNRCDRRIRLVSPDVLWSAQLGVTPAMASAIVLERISFAIQTQLGGDVSPKTH